MDFGEIISEKLSHTELMQGHGFVWAFLELRIPYVDSFGSVQ
jgi:hypothetical protein